MPRKGLHGRTCGMSRHGGRARTLQPSRRSAANAPVIAATRTSLQRVPRGWAGKGPAANSPPGSSAMEQREVVWSAALTRQQAWRRPWCPGSRPRPRP
ncbi:hypothetical protein XarjCFBP7653_17885 [Xanthomonas arboricola]|nr:hypothetical protein XarjCFBP7653_17885 [Xanthomonas arboricola]